MERFHSLSMFLSEAAKSGIKFVPLHEMIYSLLDLLFETELKYRQVYGHSRHAEECSNVQAS